VSDPILKGNPGAKSKSNPGVKGTPSAKGETDSKRPPRRRHLNLRAVVVLAVLVLVGSLGFFLAKKYQDSHQGSALLAEAKQLLEQEPKQTGKALNYLNRYLELNPKDMDALDLKSKVLFDLVRTGDQALEAIPSHKVVVLADTQHTHREARRRLVQLNMAVGQRNTAHTQALDLVRKDATAVDYRLLGDTVMILGNNKVATVTTVDGGTADTWDEAIKCYEEAQRLEPGNVYGATRLAILYQSRRNDPKKAKQVLDTLLEEAKTDDEKALAHSARYDYFARGNQSELARAELDQAVKLKPNDADILLKAAGDAFRRGDTEASRRFVEAIPPEVRRKDRQYAILGQIDVHEQKVDDAIQDWRTGLKATGGTSDVLTWQLAWMLLRLGRLSEAEPLIAQYHRLTDRVEPVPKAVYLDALLLLKKNLPTQALPKLEAIRLKTDDTAGATQQGLDDGASLGAEVAFTLGQCYEAIGKDQQALEAFHDAAKIVRNARGLKWADPWAGAANVLQRANRLDDAATELQDGLIAIPNDPTLLLKLGRIRLVQQARLPKEQRRALGDVDKLLDEVRKTNPNSIELISLQVANLDAAGRLEDAAALLASATDPKNNPRNPELWALQANVLRRLGERDKAKEALDRGTAAVGEQSVLRITRAQLLLSQGRDKEGYETLEEGVALVPPDQRPALLKALGDLRRRAKDMFAARKAYTEWAKLAPQDPQPQLLLLELALADDDEPAARAAIDAAKKIGGLAEHLADVFVLLKDPTGSKAEDPEARSKRLDEAGKIISAIIDQNPGRPVGYLLRAQLLEKQGQTDQAVQAYREARDHNGGMEALGPLFILLARQRKFDDLRRLRNELYAGELTPELEQFIAGFALTLGEPGAAKEMIQDMVKNDPQGVNARIFQAKGLNALGDPKQAEEILQTLIQQRPVELAPRIALLELQLNQKQFDKAAETVEQIRARVKTEKPEYVWAVCYAQLGNLDKAIENYKAALQKWPDDPEVRERAIAFFQSTSHIDDAVAALRELLKREPNHGWARRELAQTLSTRRNDPVAWNEAIKLIGDKSTDTDTAEDLLVRATVLLRAPDQSHTQDATRILEDLVARENLAAVGLMARDILARLYADSNQLAKALPHAQAAVERSNKDPNRVAYYAELLLRDKQPAEAAKQVDRLARLEPDTLRVIDLRSRILVAQGHSAEAAALLETTYSNVEKLPNGEAVGRKIIDMLVALNQLDAAERVARRLTDLWPKSSWSLGQVLAHRGKLDEALKLCQAAVKAGAPFEGGTIAGTLVTDKSKPLGVDAPARLKQADAILDAALKQLPNNLTLLFIQATVQRAQGRYTDAAQLYRNLLAQNPDNPLALNNLAWTLSEDLNQPAEGLERIDAAIQRMGRQPSLLDTRGVILTRLGKFDQAISDLEAAIQTSQTPSAAIYYHLARAYQKAGRTAEFQKSRTRAKEAGLNATLLEPSERVEMDKLMNQ
jgi:cellulose synthase operon protein C